MNKEIIEQYSEYFNYVDFGLDLTRSIVLPENYSNFNDNIIKICILEKN